MVFWGRERSRWTWNAPLPMDASLTFTFHWAQSYLVSAVLCMWHRSFAPPLILLELPVIWSTPHPTASLTVPKPLTVWIPTNCGKFLKTWEYQTTLCAFWEICMQDKKQQLELDMEQWTGSRLKRSMSRLFAVTLLIQLLCRVHNAKCQAGWSKSWNQDCWEKYQ